MPFKRKRPELKIDQEVKDKLEQISKSLPKVLIVLNGQR